MPTFRLKRFTHPQSLQAINPHSLLELLQPHRAFFAGRGLRLPSEDSRPSFDYAALVKVLATPDTDTPKDLADTLYFIHEMSTAEGMDALLEHVSLEQLRCSFLEATPADIAVRVWLYDRQILERTHAEMFASLPRRFDYFQTYIRPVPPFDAPEAARLRPLEEALNVEFERKGRGRGTRVFAYPHEHDCVFLVRHGEPYRREGTMHGSEVSSVLYRPLRFDVVIYDLRTGTLRVHAQTKWVTSLYRGQFGKHLFGLLDYFPDIGRYSLEPLRSGESACLACADVSGIKTVALIEIHLDWGGVYGEVEVHKASNVFAAFKKRRAAMPTQPQIIRATFTLSFKGSNQKRSVTIQPPNVAHYSRDDDSPRVDAWLSKRGFIKQTVAECHEEADALLAGH